MSETVKTWDGYRVWRPLYYPKNPQQTLKGIPDRMAVVDARPRPADIFITVGSFFLLSPNGTIYMVSVADDGALLVTSGTFGFARSTFGIGHYEFTVDDDGALHVSDTGATGGIDLWDIYSPNGTHYQLVVDTDLAVLINLAPGEVLLPDTLGHWWDTPTVITDQIKEVNKESPYGSVGSITQDGEEVWMEE